MNSRNSTVDEDIVVAAAPNPKNSSKSIKCNSVTLSTIGNNFIRNQRLQRQDSPSISSALKLSNGKLKLI